MQSFYPAPTIQAGEPAAAPQISSLARALSTPTLQIPGSQIPQMTPQAMFQLAQLAKSSPGIAGIVPDWWKSMGADNTVPGTGVMHTGLLGTPYANAASPGSTQTQPM